MKHRYDIESIGLNLKYTEESGIPFSKMLVFNKGEKYVGMDKKTGAELIPKVVHQAWLGG